VRIMNHAEAKDFALKAIAECAWRNGYLSNLAAEALKTNPKVGDFIDKTWLKKIKDNESIRLADCHFTNAQAE